MKNRYTPLRSVPLTLAGLPSVLISERARLPNEQKVAVCGTAYYLAIN